MTLTVKGIIFEDFINYKKPCMVIEMPRCDFKCDRECGRPVCQNSSLAKREDIKVNIDDLIQCYCNDDITEAIVFQGLEPFYSPYKLYRWVEKFREYTDDDIVIYTGFYYNEIIKQVEYLKQYKNIIIKYGRFRPNNLPHFDNILGVYLASDNQYAERIS